MKNYITNLRTFALGALFLPAVCSAAIVNGGFEDPVLASTFNFTGAFSFSAWSAFSTGTGGGSNSGLVLGSDPGLAPFEGNQHFSFNGGNSAPGSFIEQTFSTTPGQTYAVSFAIGRNGVAGQSLALNAEVFNAVGESLTSYISQAPSSASYQLADFVFVANSATSRLRFTDVSGSNPNADVFLDSVSVVPEPSAAILLLSAGSVCLCVRRRANNAPADRKT